MAIEIIDASHYQGTPDWKKVAAAGTKAVILKATQGVRYGYTDWYKAQKAAAEAAGLHVLAYHFANALGDPKAQAAYFVQTAGDLTPYTGLPSHWLDLEKGDGDQTAFTLAFLAEVERLTGRIPGFYSYGAYVRAHITASATALKRFPLWIAAYQANVPPTPAPWDKIAVWQFTSGGSVTGIEGRVDCNIVLNRPAPAVPVVFVEKGSPEAALLVHYPSLFGRPTRILGPNDVPATDNTADIAFGTPVWGAGTQIRGKDRYETLNLALKYLAGR